jgi:hypothetical protein
MIAEWFVCLHIVPNQHADRDKHGDYDWPTVHGHSPDGLCLGMASFFLLRGSATLSPRSSTDLDQQHTSSGGFLAKMRQVPWRTP